MAGSQKLNDAFRKRKLVQANQERLGSHTGRTGMTRTASNIQMALPKQREPLASLKDKNIPYDYTDEDELVEIRRWARLYYATHDLVPLLVDIYAKFPTSGLSLECFAHETEVITDQGIMSIGDMAGETHRVLTTGGKWVSAPVKSFGVRELRRVTLKRNGRTKVVYATPGHRWFVQEQHQKRLGRNSSKWSDLTWESVDEIRSLKEEGWRQVDIAEKFGVSQVMVSKIINHKSWTDEQRAKDVVRPEPGWSKIELVTDELAEGHKLVPSFGRNRVYKTTPSAFGVAHGMVLGDGSLESKPSGGSFVDLYGEKDANLFPYFSMSPQASYAREGLNVDHVRISGLPRFFKSLPDINESVSYLYGWLSGYFAADGTVSKKGEVSITTSSKENADFIQSVCSLLGIKTTGTRVIPPNGGTTVFPQGNEFVREDDYYSIMLANESLNDEFFVIPEHRKRWEEHKDRDFNESWTVVSVEETDREEEVFCAVVPETEAFTLEGNILTGNCKDPEVTKFYEEMFFDNLNYDTFIQDIGREFFTVGECTTLAHFDELLGVWSNEEILNPDQLVIRRPLFEPSEKIYLKVDDLVDGLQENSGVIGEETGTERSERAEELRILKKFYPEIVEAANRGEPLELAESLTSRMTNKISYWDLRGTPHMLRSFRTLIREESLNAAQDAVADRLYSPFILAKLGIQNVDGSGNPWIPTADDVTEVRDDLQAALAADFRLMVNHFGLDVQSVFGRESVPRFDNDYDRIDEKILQAWGIGKSLISGGSGGPYASSALNREFVTQMMSTFQSHIRGHMKKRMEVIAEAQEHYDYELQGGVRVPVMQEIVQENPETGERYIEKVPKLLIPEVVFPTINLRDEQTERAFLNDLKSAGVPLSDHAFSSTIKVDFEEELERKADEDIKKYVAQAESMVKARMVIEKAGLPLPPDLAGYFLQSQQAQLQEMMNAAMPGQMEAGGGPPPEGGEGGQPQTEELPRNQARPAESDEMRESAPRAASLKAGPSSFGHRTKVSKEEVAKRLIKGSFIKVDDLLDGGYPDLLAMLSLDSYASEYQADKFLFLDWLHYDVMAEDVPESNREAYAQLLEALDVYENTYGGTIQW